MKTANCHLNEIIQVQDAHQDNEAIQILCRMFKPDAEANARQYRSFVCHSQAGREE